MTNFTTNSVSIANGFSNSYPATDDVAVFTLMSDYFNEPIPNGDRINMGAYGGTELAAKTFKVAGDFDGNGDVDGTDFYSQSSRYGEIGCGGYSEDINCDNNVDDIVLELLAVNFGK